jgi:hypothetical protein
VQQFCVFIKSNVDEFAFSTSANWAPISEMTLLGVGEREPATNKNNQQSSIEQQSSWTMLSACKSSASAVLSHLLEAATALAHVNAGASKPVYRCHDDQDSFLELGASSVFPDMIHNSEETLSLSTRELHERRSRSRTIETKIACL